MKTIRVLAGVLLLPFCAAATMTVTGLMRSIRPEAAWAVAVGFGVWQFLYFVLPRPVRSYVLAHELTHALWGWLMGAKVSRLRISDEKGSVTLSKSNFLIALAPYFFPFYTVLVVAAYYLLSIFFKVSDYNVFWLGLVGFTWGFHCTFTVTTLLQSQSDVAQYGRLFSYALIYLLNVLGVAVWIVLVSPATLEELVRLLTDRTTGVFEAAWLALTRIVGRLGQ